MGVHAGQLALKSDLRLVQEYRRSLLPCLEQARRPTLDHHVHRSSGLGVWGLISENWYYQKCRLVRDLALSLGIDLLFLPTYSPNLNLIERLWKFVKKQCLYSIYYNDFAVFKQAISACLAQTNTVHKATLDSLLTLRFQTFSKSQIVRR